MRPDAPVPSSIAVPSRHRLALTATAIVSAAGLALVGLAPASAAPSAASTGFSATQWPDSEPDLPRLPLGQVKIAGSVFAGESVTARVSASALPANTRLSYTWYTDDSDSLPEDARWSEWGGHFEDNNWTSTMPLPETLAPGSKLSLEVSATKSGYAETSKVTTVTVGQRAKSVGPGRVVVSGENWVGGTLSAAASGWSVSPDRVRYQWFADGTPIWRETKRTYTVEEWRAGARFSVKAYAIKAGYNAGVASAVTAGPSHTTPITGPTPRLSGTAKVGKTLTATAGTWSPKGVKLSYQFLRNGKAIKGATKSKYTLVAADRGAKITVKVTGTVRAGVFAEKVSKATAKVAAGTLAGPTPTISGTAKVGRTLTAKAGSWKPAGVTLKYQWFAGSTKVVGATKSTFTIKRAQKKLRLSVVVTASKAGYTTATKKSKATSAVR